jgi:hypothetical protein
VETDSRSDEIETDRPANGAVFDILSEPTMVSTFSIFLSGSIPERMVEMSKWA